MMPPLQAKYELLIQSSWVVVSIYGVKYYDLIFEILDQS